MPMHPFWGQVEEDWAGFSATYQAHLPEFKKPLLVFLGDEYDDEGEEVTAAPTPAQLDAYAATLQAFLADAPGRVAELKQQAFAHYQQYYAPYYDDPARSGDPPLHLDAEQHFAHLQDVDFLRVSAADTLRLVFGYDLDPEHGLEAKFVAGQPVKIGNIAET